MFRAAVLIVSIIDSFHLRSETGRQRHYDSNYLPLPAGCRGIDSWPRAGLRHSLDEKVLKLSHTGCIVEEYFACLKNPGADRAAKRLIRAQADGEIDIARGIRGHAIDQVHLTTLGKGD